MKRLCVLDVDGWPSEASLAFVWSDRPPYRFKAAELPLDVVCRDVKRMVGDAPILVNSSGVGMAIVDGLVALGMNVMTFNPAKAFT